MVKVYEAGEVYFDGKAPVPSYEEWQSYDKCANMLIDVNKKWHKTIVENKKLKKKLAIATKALRYYAQCKHINLDLVTIPDACAEFEAFDDGEHARQALKEMEGVK